MVFNTLEELQSAVEERRQSILTLEVDMANSYSAEHEAAKQELAQAEGMKVLTGGQGFLSDNIDSLKKRVEDTKPPQKLVWLQYKKLELKKWASLIKQAGSSPIDQYEKVLPETFVGVYGQDPVKPEDVGEEEWDKPEPLTTDARYVSTLFEGAILAGGALSSVVNTFMTWQNAGGEVTLRPTNSGLV